MSGKPRLPEYLQGQTRQVPIHRSINLSFQTVRDAGEFFAFYLNGKIVGTVLKSVLTDRQLNFFDGISETR